MSNTHRTGGMGNWHCSAALALAACCCFGRPGWSQESPPESNAVPDRVSASVTNLLAGLHVKQGFRIELVASERQVTAPVAMAFDENGRLFVVERPQEPGQDWFKVPAGRVRLFEDTEGTGEFRPRGVYAENLPWASAVTCYGGGIFVAAGHDLIFLKDSKTNGVADTRKLVFSGFGGTNALEASALPNNFNWGLDNHIHAANTGLAGAATLGSVGFAPLLLTGGDFAFDPRMLTVSLESGPRQTGLTFDDTGRKYFCDPTHPLRRLPYEQRYLARNLYMPAPKELVEVASPPTAIFRFVWKVVPPPATVPALTTNEPAPAVVRATPVLAGGWLTNAQGCVVYRGAAFPAKYNGNVFIADPSAHIIHRAVLSEAGLDLAAFRAPDETTTEFVTSSDPRFCPVQIINGPDGALYVADRQDGLEGGRIYRIVPANFKPPKPPRLGHAKTYDLVALLSHPHGWQRDTAARLLYERRDPAALPLLGAMLDSRVPLGRLHALHVLDGLGALNEGHLLHALQDSDERVREHAVQLCERLIAGGVIPDPLWNQLYRMPGDSSIRVRFQLALTAGEIRRTDRAQVLTGIVRRDAANAWMRTAVMSSLGEGAGDLFVYMAGDPQARADRVGLEWLRRLATLVGVKAEPSEVAAALGFLEQASIDPLHGFDLLCALGDGLHYARSSLGLMDPQSRLRGFYSMALDRFQNYNVPEALRVEELRLLGVGPFTFAENGDLLLLELGSGQPALIQSAAIAALGRYADPRVAPALIQRWGLLAPRLRHEALAALLSRSDRNAAVLAAIESGRIAKADLTHLQANYLRTYRDPAISLRAVQLLGPVPAQRPEVLKRFKPALSLRGFPERGQALFVARCVACHPADRATQGLGPELGMAKLCGKERTLTAILEPDANVWREFLSYVAETADGNSLIGVLRGENAAAVTLVQANGVAVVLPRGNIQYLQPQPWSLMPPGLEEGLTTQDMADLLRYLLGPTASP